MEEKTITRIPAMPLALMLGTIEAVFGLIGGLIAAGFWGTMISMITTMPNYQGPSAGFFQIFFGIGAMILFPIMGFISGLIQGLIVAVVYNFLAPRIGGIRLQFG
jgi:uncharacterized membrane protein YkgB